MGKGHVLVVADSVQHAEYLAHSLLPGAGFEATLADETASPPAVDVVLVDVDRVLVSPLAGLHAQRRMGCRAPALLVAPRLNEAMASEIFELNIRGFVTKPAQEAHLLEKLESLLDFAGLEQDRQALAEHLHQQDEVLQRRLTELETLSHVGRALSSVADLQTVLARIVDAAVYLARAEEGALFLTDEQGKLYVRAEKNLGQREVKVLNDQAEDSTAMQVFRTGEPVLQAGETGPLKVKTDYLVHALINVPIIIGDQIVGVLAVYNHSQKSFEIADMIALAALGDYAALALSRMEALATVQERVEGAAEATLRVFHHTGEMHSPIEAIEAQVDMLLSGKPGPITEAQSDALHRIRLSTVRLKEIDEMVRQVTERYTS